MQDVLFSPHVSVLWCTTHGLSKTWSKYFILYYNFPQSQELLFPILNGTSFPKNLHMPDPCSYHKEMLPNEASWSVHDTNQSLSCHGVSVLMQRNTVIKWNEHIILSHVNDKNSKMFNGSALTSRQWWLLSFAWFKFQTAIISKSVVLPTLRALSATGLLWQAVRWG